VKSQQQYSGSSTSVQQQLDILITAAGVVATESEMFATPAADLRVERRGGMVTAAIARREDTCEV
jgi:hypothetical protein